MKRLLKILLGLLATLCLLLVAFLKPIPEREIKDQAYFQSTLGKIKALNTAVDSTSGKLTIGWSKKTLIDGTNRPLAGFGARFGKEYQEINDSIWTRTVYFDDGKRQVAYISVDLLIFPPVIRNALFEKIKNIGMTPDQLFLTATHSHSSIGGWQEGFVGRLMSGKYKQETVDFISSQIVASIREARTSANPSSISSMAFNRPDLVRNRLAKGKKGGIDPWFRVVKMTRDNGEIGYITNFSAHPTCFNEKFMDLSGDYPGILCSKLESNDDISFSMFGAGAMASMTILTPAGNSHEIADYMSDQLSNEILNAPGEFKEGLGVISRHRVSLGLPAPAPRISKHFALREWVFNALVGKPKPEISWLKVGNILFVGLPCDFSGELSDELYKMAADKGMFLVINGFNGDYLGYVVKDQWYYIDKHETKWMNWYGYGMGEYLSLLTKEIINAY